MLTAHLASGHPALNPRLLTLRRLSISGMLFQSPIVHPGYPAEQSYPAQRGEWRGAGGVFQPKVEDAGALPAEGAGILPTKVFFLHSSLYIPKCSSRSTLYSKRNELNPGGHRLEVPVFFLHSSLHIPKCSLRSMLYSSRSELFPGGPKAGGAGVLPAKRALPIKAFFAAHALLDKERH